jgi:hypothetical protein
MSRVKIFDAARDTGATRVILTGNICRYGYEVIYGYREASRGPRVYFELLLWRP